LRLLISDEIVDPIEARVDIAVRIGRPAETALAVRPLARWDLLICASPAYLFPLSEPVPARLIEGIASAARRRSPLSRRRRRPPGRRGSAESSVRSP
jgi:hypothetical protein